MKRLFAIAILGVAALGMTQTASAGWLKNCCCKHKCCLSLSARQYNAFSPYCLDSFNGCFPLQGMAGNGACYMGNMGGACSSQAGVACLGELPNAAALASLPQGGTYVQGPINVAPLPPGVTVQGAPTFAPSYPTGVPSYFPAPGGFGQANVQGR